MKIYRLISSVMITVLLLLSLCGCGGNFYTSYETEEDEMAQYNYTRRYGSFRGVDFTSDERDVDASRFVDLVNMYRDYDSANGACVETFPGYREFADLGMTVYGMFQFKTPDADYVIVHAGDGLFYFENDGAFSFTQDDLDQHVILSPDYGTMAENKSTAIMFNDKMYLIDGQSLWQIAYTPSTLWMFTAASIASTRDAVTPYVNHTVHFPLTHINGEVYEQRNMATEYASEQFVMPATVEALDLLYEKKTVSNVTYYIFPFHNDVSYTSSTASYFKCYVKIGILNISSMWSKIYTYDDVTGKITGIGLAPPSAEDLCNVVVDMDYQANLSKFDTVDGQADFAAANPGYTGTSKEAILGCTIMATFDGRVFLTGNPALPNTVFYCNRNLSGAADPTYWGVYNYWNDGVGGFPNVALLASGSTLMVFKGDSEQDGTVYFRTPVDNTDEATQNIIPRLYVGTQGADGVGCLGAALNFYDDPVFLSRRGLDAISKEQVNLERSVKHRSSNVDRKLCQEDLAHAKMVEWKQYLMIFCPSGHVYMADSRAVFSHPTGSTQYEWYYLEGFGRYQNKAKLFRYDDDQRLPCTGTPQYYPQEGVYKEAETGKVLVWDGEYTTSGTFYGCDIPLVIGDILYFTAGRRIFRLNNDLRGKDVYEYEQRAGDPDPVNLTHLYVCPGTGMTPDEDGYITVTIYNVGTFYYRKANEYPTPPTVIPRWFYSYDGVKITSGAITKIDDAGIPTYCKDTVFGTLVLGTKAMPGSRIKVMVEKDGSGWEQIAQLDNGQFDFADTEFDAFSFNGETVTGVAIRRRELRWYRKQYQFYSDEYARPFGIHDLSYVCEIAGKVKNK